MSEADKEQMMKDFKMPSMDEMMAMVDSMKGVTEEHKDKLREHLIKSAVFANPFLDGQIPAVDAIAPATSFELITMAIYFVMLTSFISVLAFFGYKLYKSLVERDRKREEKLKAKQSKKKK